MRVVLFEWTSGGHRPIYVRRFVEALSPSADVLLALPQPTLDELGDLEADFLSLGASRPPFGGRLGRRSILKEEITLFRDAASRGDRALHLYGDNILIRLVSEQPFPCPTSLLLFYPRAHYPAAYGSRLSPADRAVALGKEWAVGRWRRRSDAQALFTLDEEAARRWEERRGATARWLPEPPVPSLPADGPPLRRDGCVVYGYLDARKGLDLIERALTLAPTPIRLVVAGTQDDRYAPQLARHLAAMVASSVEVDLRARQHSELEGLSVLGGASCALLTYPRHSGMSRVLVEACAVGTPVVVHRFGLLGHLVREHRLGLSVDCTDPHELRRAVLTLADPERSASYAGALAAFSAHFTPGRFRAALLGGLALIPDQLSDIAASRQVAAGHGPA